MADLPVVLVHGGAHGAWCWEPMVGYLEHPVLAVDLPPKVIRQPETRFERPPELTKLTIADFAQSVLADADAAGFDRFVLVGHSMAGVTLPEVARLAPERVAHLVFVSCTVPPDGVSSIEAVGGEVAETTARSVDDASSDGVPDAEQMMTPERIIAMFCNDMDAGQIEFELAHVGTEVPGVVVEPVSRVGMSPDIPKTWVRLLRDAILTPDLQNGYIANLEASPGGRVDVVDLDAAHNAMISRPRELAEIINRVVAATD